MFKHEPAVVATLVVSHIMIFLGMLAQMRGSSASSILYQVGFRLKI